MYHLPQVILPGLLPILSTTRGSKKKGKGKGGPHSAMGVQVYAPHAPDVSTDPAVRAARAALSRERAELLEEIRAERADIDRELGPATAPRRSSLPAERPSHFVAIHEAGHALAATLFSVEVTSIEARRETGTTWLQWPRTKTHRADIIITACGPYAQLVLAPGEGHEAWGQGRSEDWGHLQQAEAKLEAEEGSRAHQIVNDFLDEARQLVRRHAADITLLARRLIDANGDLTGAEVMDQVGHLWGAALYPWERR